MLIEACVLWFLTLQSDDTWAWFWNKSPPVQEAYVSLENGGLQLHEDCIPTPDISVHELRKVTPSVRWSDNGLLIGVSDRACGVIVAHIRGTR